WSPDANGSSVPVCPMRRTCSARRACATTSCDVGPSGLSTGSTPAAGSTAIAPRWLAVVRVRRRTGAALATIVLRGRPHLAQQALDVLGVLERAVQLEVQFGAAADAQPLADLAADERRGGLEALER